MLSAHIPITAAAASDTEAAFLLLYTMLPLDRVRPTPYDKGFAHPYFLKSFSLLNEIPLYLPHAWCKAKLVLKKMDVGERRQSLSGRGKKYPEGCPGEMSHSVPIQVLRGQGKLQIFQIIYRKGLNQICLLLLPTQGERSK